MNQHRICPNCRAAVPADAPEGVCPACALRAGFETEDGPDSPTRAAPYRRATPLPPEELARRLPELEQFQLIGQGGMGVVYKARHRKLDRLVAVKILYSDLRDCDSFAERFTREARTMAQLDHPNVVSVYDFGNRGDLYYLIMELVDGVNLRQRIEAGKLEPQEALSMVPKICEALQYAHDKGVVHRDIKPENILVDRKGAIKIADFGLAKLVGESAGRRLTRTEQIMGTPHYMAPEQFEKPGEVDHRADIYALGVVFYELLTGELPVGRFPPPSKNVRVDVRLDAVVLRTLEKEPSLRYQRASELQSEIEALSSGDSVVTGTPDDPAEQPGSRQDYEYRSSRTILGLPLVHIASSRDPSGKKMRVACGIIAIGDVAIGGVAIGAFSFGGITFGGIGVGLVGFGGVIVGLLTALGGVGIGGFAVGGLAIGLTAYGALPLSFFALTEAALAGMKLLAVLIWSVALTIGGGAAVYAWAKTAEARRLRGG
jgi:tRNA A-37 threonylcarbamoyl transferase component Bud32